MAKSALERSTGRVLPSETVALELQSRRAIIEKEHRRARSRLAECAGAGRAKDLPTSGPIIADEEQERHQSARDHLERYEGLAGRRNWSRVFGSEARRGHDEETRCRRYAGERASRREWPPRNGRAHRSSSRTHVESIAQSAAEGRLGTSRAKRAVNPSPSGVGTMRVTRAVDRRRCAARHSHDKGSGSTSSAGAHARQRFLKTGRSRLRSSIPTALRIPRVATKSASWTKAADRRSRQGRCTAWTLSWTAKASS